MSTNKEMISVIVPVFRTEKYLERCVDSLVNQIYRNFEIILVDDGSDDNSPAICDELAKKYNNIIVIHKLNGGLSSARNAGIEASNGEYICFVDSDDYVSKDYLQIMYDAINETKADLVKINYREVTGSEIVEIKRKLEMNIYSNKEVEEAFLDLKVDSACVFLYRKELIGDTRFIVGKTSEDIPFNFEIFRKAKKFCYLNEEAYFYFYNNLSISNGPLDKNMLNYLYFREDIYNYYLKSSNEVLSKKAESLYARSAFGLMSRMTLYGIADELDEKECLMLFKEVFKKHKKSFYHSDTIPYSRKIVAILVFNFYPVMKFVMALRRK